MGGGGCPGPNFFWSCQIWGQNFFPLFSALDSISAGGLGPNFFWSCQIWGQNFFPLFSALDSISAGGGGWSRTQLLWVMPKLRSKIFCLFSALDSISVGWAGGMGPNFFWSCQIWDQQFFPSFSTLDSISTDGGGGGGVRDPTLFGHAKFEVKNFSLHLALWTLFPQVGVEGGVCVCPWPNFF